MGFNSMLPYPAPGALTRKPSLSMPPQNIRKTTCPKQRGLPSQGEALQDSQTVFDSKIKHTGMQRRLSDEPPKKTRHLEPAINFQEAHDPFSFSTPPFSSPCRHARISSVLLVHTAALSAYDLHPTFTSARASVGSTHAHA